MNVGTLSMKISHKKTRTNAGFKILLAQKTHKDEEVVLGQRDSDGWYVTWICFHGDSYNWGHYFGKDMLIDAINDFVARCMN